MSRDHRSLRRRAVLVAGATGLVSVSGCVERVSVPLGEDEGDGAADPTGTPEPRIEEGDQGTGDIPLYRLAVESEGWVGLGPEGLSDEENPTLSLQEGDEYEIIWENRDGERHQFVVADSDGDELASTEPSTEYGAVQSVVITASPLMSNYLCPLHSDSERAEIEIV